MTVAFVEPSRRRDKCGPSREAVEDAWQEWLRERDRAMKSTDIRTGIRAGRAWGAFLRLFEAG